MSASLSILAIHGFRSKPKPALEVLSLPRCLFINFFSSFQYTQVSENDPISLIKNLVSEKLGIPAVQQRLVFKGKTLAGNYRLHVHYDYFTLVQRHIGSYAMLLVERNRALGPVQTPNVS